MPLQFERAAPPRQCRAGTHSRRLWVIRVSCGAFGIGPVYYRMLPSQRAYQAGTVDQEPTFRSRCEPGGFRPQVGRSPRRASDTGSGRPVACIVGKNPYRAYVLR